MSRKKSLSFEEMIPYLNSNKNICFAEIKEKEAVKLLDIYGYNNIISPFKYKMADKDPKNISNLLMINGKHSYSKQTDFKDWYKLFVKERSSYPLIYKNVVKIKTAFKNILFNTIFLENNIHSKEDLERYFAEKRLTCIINNGKNDKYTLKTLDNLKYDLDKSYNIYYFVGKAGLGDCNNLFMALDSKQQKTIMHFLQDLQLCPKPIDASKFNKRMVSIQYIRNYIMHNDSLEILCRYYNRSKKGTRTDSDRKHYQNLVHSLSIEQ